MRLKKPVICVFSSDEGGAPFWMSREDRHRIEHATNLASVERVVSARGGEIEYAGVILDRSVSAAEYLHLMTRLAPQFRGDMLRIDRDGSGVLSTCAIREGRYLYRLEPSDVAFYLDARFNLSESCAFEAIHQPALRLTA